MNPARLSPAQAWRSFSAGSVQVAYTYAGRNYDRSIYLDDDSPSYCAGQAVRVRVDPGHPSDVTIAESDNLPPWQVALASLLLVGGGVVFIGGLVWLPAAARQGKIAAVNRWRPARIIRRVIPYNRRRYL